MPLANTGKNVIADQITGRNTKTEFSEASGQIGVGDGTAAFVNTQTDLQGTNKVYVGQDLTYPQVTNNVIVWQSTFDDGVAEFHWQEWGIFNGSPGDMWSRELDDKGTKAAGDIWVATATITIPY